MIHRFFMNWIVWLSYELSRSSITHYHGRSISLQPLIYDYMRSYQNLPSNSSCSKSNFFDIPYLIEDWWVIWFLSYHFYKCLIIIMCGCLQRTRRRVTVTLWCPHCRRSRSTQPRHWPGLPEMVSGSLIVLWEMWLGFQMCKFQTWHGDWYILNIIQINIALE